MTVSIINNNVWEFKTGEVVREEKDFVVVKVLDPYIPNWSYNVRFPRTMIKYEKVIAQA